MTTEITKLNLPERVTIILRDPEKRILETPQTRAVLDLFFIAENLPADAESHVNQYHAFLFLAQEFGVIDEHFSDFTSTVGSPAPMSGSLSYYMNATLQEAVVEDKDYKRYLSPKYKDLTIAVGGIQTFEYIKAPIIKRLVEIAREKKLVNLSKYISLKKSCVDLRKWFSQEERTKLESLEQELLSMAL